MIVPVQRGEHSPRVARLLVQLLHQSTLETTDTLVDFLSGSRCGQLLDRGHCFGDLCLCSWTDLAKRVVGLDLVHQFADFMYVVLQVGILHVLEHVFDVLDLRDRAVGAEESRTDKVHGWGHRDARGTSSGNADGAAGNVTDGSHFG